MLLLNKIDCDYTPRNATSYRYCNKDYRYILLKRSFIIFIFDNISASVLVCTRVQSLIFGTFTYIINVSSNGEFSVQCHLSHIKCAKYL